jgi:hypothetical protein
MNNLIPKFFRTLFISEQQLPLGRWRLKHTQEKLNIFYNQIPDPGYKNNYLTQEQNSLSALHIGQKSQE